MARDVADLMPPIDENVGDGLPPPGAFAPGKAKKERKKRHLVEKKADISINSLLDVLSVLLVFLLKSYSASSIQLKPDKDLHPPFSYSALAPEESTAITVTLNHIMVDDKPCVTLENGHVSSRDQAQGGMLIQPLFEELQSAVDHQKRVGQRNSKEEFKGIVTIISDRFVKSPLILQVMYTAGLAEFSKFKFMLCKVERS